MAQKISENTEIQLDLKTKQFQMSNLTVPVIETRAQIHDTESEAFISATAIVFSTTGILLVPHVWGRY